MTYQTTEINDMSKASFVSETFKYRIVVSQVTTGSQKQIDYANSLKSKAMGEVDRFATNFLEKVSPKNKSAFNVWKDALLSAIDADTDAQQVLNKLADVRMDTESIMKIYNVLPQQYA